MQRCSNCGDPGTLDTLDTLCLTGDVPVLLTRIAPRETYCVLCLVQCLRSRRMRAQARANAARTLADAAVDECARVRATIHSCGSCGGIYNKGTGDGIADGKAESKAYGKAYGKANGKADVKRSPRIAHARQLEAARALARAEAMVQATASASSKASAELLDAVRVLAPYTAAHVDA